MYRGKKRKRPLRRNAFEVEVKLDVPSRRGRIIRLEICGNYKVEDLKAKIHYEWSIPFDERGDIWMETDNDNMDMKHLPDGKLLRDFSLGPTSKLVYTEAH